MHLPDFVLLVIGTLAAIAAGLAVLTSNYRVARVLFWIAALAFGSLGVVWSATSEGYSLPTQMVVSATIGAIAAAGLTWTLWEIREKESTEVKTASNTEQVRRPTLEATNNSTIAARDAKIPGDLPFQVGRADKDSLIDLSGSNFSKNPDGSITFTPGNPEFQFPAPTGEFAKLSTADLRKRLISTANDLENIQNQLDQDFRVAERTQAAFIGVYEKHRATLERYFDLSHSLACAALAKIGKLSAIPAEAASGGILVYHRKFAGPKPAHGAAVFLSFLAAQLPHEH